MCVCVCADWFDRDDEPCSVDLVSLVVHGAY